MKTKKRLQALITVAAMLSMLCGSLPAAHADEPPAAEAMPSYRASDYYDAENHTNPMVKDGVSPWEWDYYDMESKTYIPMQYSEASTGKVFASHSGWGNVTRMDGTTMHGDARKDGDGSWTKTGSYTGAWQQYYPVRSFTAPKSGRIMITEEGGKIVYAGTAGSQFHVYLRIMLESNGSSVRVWPENEDYKGVNISAGEIFPGLTLDIKKGDILRFYMYTPKASTNGSNYLHVKWSPIVSYSYVMPEYQASDVFEDNFIASASSSNANDKAGAYRWTAPWSWQYYTVSSGAYADLPGGFKSGDGAFATTTTYPLADGVTDPSSGKAVRRDGSDNASTKVGRYWMTTDLSSNLKDYYAVRTFTVPQTGTVTVTAENLDAAFDGKIRALQKNTGTNKIGVRLVKGISKTDRQQIWPLSAGETATEVDDGGIFAYVPQSSAIDFPPLTIPVTKGEQLHFELANLTGSTGWDIVVYWDPKISYHSYCEAQGLETADMDGLALDHEFALTFKNALTETVTAENIKISGGSAAFAKSVAMDNDNKTIKFSFDGLEFGKSYDVAIMNPADSWEILYKYTFTTMEGPAQYKVSDYFDISNNPYTKDGKSPWTWNYRDLADNSYKKLNYANTTTGYWALTGAWGQTVRMNGTTMYGDGRASEQGGFTADEVYTKAFQRYYPVRSFAAPVSGNVSITANGVVSSSGTSQYPYLRIMLEHNGIFTKVWPKDKEYYEIYLATQIDNFAASLQEVKAGDILHFEMITTGDNQRADWDPVVTYVPSFASDKSEVTFSGGLDFSSVAAALTANSVTVTVPATAYYMSSNSVVPAAAVYDASGAVLSCGVGEKQSVKMNQQANLEVLLPQISGTAPTGGYIKVFLLSGDGLTPLSDIGAEPVLGTALAEFEAQAVYVGTGEPGQQVALMIKDEQGKILYLEQGVADANGRFCIPVPAELKDKNVLCNLSGETIEANCIYASNAGAATGAGTKISPLSFQKALELANDGETVIVMDEIVLPSDFVWPTAQKSVIISGAGEGAALNLYQLPNATLKINTDVTFEKLEFASTATGNAEKVGGIRARGNVVTISESVSTRGIFGSFYGGVENNWESVKKTETYIYGGNFSRIYGGGGYVENDCKLTVGGNTNTTSEYGDPSIETNKDFEPIIYGGTLDNTVAGDCITTIKGNAAARYLYGGSLDNKEHADRGAGVKGKTVVNLEGGKFMNVYGMNPPSPRVSTETVDYSSDVTINMTDGTVEALFGSSADTLANSIQANVTVNALGGTVTRRIIGGVYNENGWYSDSGKYITGDVNVVVGSGLQGMTDKQTGHGIFGGSRIQNNPTAENAKLIFLGGSYNTFKKHINADSIDCKSHHDYLVTGTEGGNIIPKTGSVVEIIPENGHIAQIDFSVIEAGVYTLSKEQTDVVFTDTAFYSLTGSLGAGGVNASVSYISESGGNIMILALYDGDNLAAIKQESVAQGTHDKAVEIPYTAESGKTYTLKAFMWNSMNDIVPLCAAKSVDISAAE